MEGPAEFVFPPDPSALMAIADYLGLDRLFRRGAELIHEHIRRSSGCDDETCKMIAAMSNPARQRLLDTDDPAVFERLRESITPYRHQDRSMVQRMLYSNHFARSCTLQGAQETFCLLRRVQKNISAHMWNGFCELKSLARSDKCVFSPDYRSLASLDRYTLRLTLYDLLTWPLAPVDLHHGVIDFAFSPQGALVLLRWDGGVSVYRDSMEIYSLKSGANNDGLAVSEQCALTFSTIQPWLRNQFDPIASARLWSWAASKSAEQMPALSSATNVCLSSDGTFVAYCEDGGEIRTFSVSPGSSDAAHTLLTPNAMDRLRTGSILTLMVSDDETVLLAAYANIIRVWDLEGGREWSEYDLGVAHSETVGHAAISSDGRLIALGSWEGHITLLRFSKDASCGLVEVDRMLVDMSILHLDWSPDRMFFAISSHSGLRVIESRFLRTD